MDDLNHLTDKARNFLFHMQQRHRLTTPLFLNDMSSEQQALAHVLTEERLLVESHVEELELEAEETICYCAPHPSWFYYGKLGQWLIFAKPPCFLRFHPSHINLLA